MPFMILIFDAFAFWTFVTRTNNNVACLIFRFRFELDHQFFLRAEWKMNCVRKEGESGYESERYMGIGHFGQMENQKENWKFVCDQWTLMEMVRSKCGIHFL